MLVVTSRRPGRVSAEWVLFPRRRGEGQQIAPTLGNQGQKIALLLGFLPSPSPALSWRWRCTTPGFPDDPLIMALMGWFESFPGFWRSHHYPPYPSGQYCSGASVYKTPAERLSSHPRQVHSTGSQPVLDTARWFSGQPAGFCKYGICEEDLPLWKLLLPWNWSPVLLAWSAHNTVNKSWGVLLASDLILDCAGKSKAGAAGKSLW